MPKLKSLCVGFSLALLMVSAAEAQVTIDVSRITCEQLRNNVANPVALALWLSGYYAGKRNETTIDVLSLDRNAEKVSEYCGYNPSVGLMQAIETASQAGRN
jgi:acid stress chaperone HdeB